VSQSRAYYSESSSSLPVAILVALSMAERGAKTKQDLQMVPWFLIGLTAPSSLQSIELGGFPETVFQLY